MANQHSSGATILVVDDSPTVAAQLQRLLEAAGYSVVVESNPMFAPQAVVRHSPRLVLLDVAMRSLSGTRVASILGTDRRRSRAPMRIVFYSSLPEEELAAFVEETGVDGYISKSEPHDVLLSEVRSLLAELE